MTTTPTLTPDTIARAARAAGIPGRFDEGFIKTFLVDPDLVKTDAGTLDRRVELGLGPDIRPWWNPVVDDGDAWRLAVKLRLFGRVDDFVADQMAAGNPAFTSRQAWSARFRLAVTFLAAEVAP